MSLLTAAIDDPGLFDSLREDAQRVVNGALRLIQDLLRGATQDDGACLTQRHATETDHALLPDNHLWQQ